MMKSINRRSLLYFALAVAAALALYGLSARLAAEGGGKTAAFVTDSREIFSLAYQSGKTPADVWREVNALGVAGAAVSEFTGDELAMYSSLGVRFGPAAVFTAKLNADAARAVLCWSKNSPYGAQLRSYLERKLPNVGFVEASGNVYALLPGTVEEFKSSALVPDFSALEFCRANGADVLFRPGPCTPSSGADVAEALDWLTNEYPQIKNIIPAGAILAGYPDVRPLAAVMKAKGITLSQVEFVRQIGVPALARNLGSLVVPMHSLTKEEIISRSISRPTIVDRYVRAVHERSIRLVMVHPYDLQMGARLDIFLKDLGEYKAALEARGYALGWPKPLPVWPAPLAGAFACGICFVFTLWFYGSRMNGSEKLPVPLSSALALFAASAALGGALWYSSAAARLAGGICGALVATEAALCALESAHSRVRGAVLALLTVIARRAVDSFVLRDVGRRAAPHALLGRQADAAAAADSDFRARHEAPRPPGGLPRGHAPLAALDGARAARRRDARRARYGAAQRQRLERPGLGGRLPRFCREYAHSAAAHEGVHDRLSGARHILVHGAQGADSLLPRGAAARRGARLLLGGQHLLPFPHAALSERDTHAQRLVARPADRRRLRGGARAGAAAA